MDGLLHLVQRRGAWADWGSAQSHPRCTKCNRPPVNGQCTNFILLSRVSILMCDIHIANLSVRPSVRYVPVPYENGLTYRHSFFHHTVYHHQTFSQHSGGVTPCGRAKYRWGIKISQFSTNRSPYLANDTTYRHSYYGRRIGTRMWSIKRCHFQWPWTNRNPVFKVTPLFDTNLTNGYRYGHSYYRRRIGNRTQDFEWHQFQWPWVTSNQMSRSRYYSTSNNSKMVQNKAIFTMADQ